MLSTWAIKALSAAEISPTEAITNESVRLTGSPHLLARLVETFQIPPRPAAVPTSSREISAVVAYRDHRFARPSCSYTSSARQ